MKKTSLLLYLLLTAHVLLAQQRHTFKQNIPATGINKGTVRIEVPAGVLQVKATGSNFLDTQVQYGQPSWKPSLHLNKNNGVADLRLTQKDITDGEDNNDNKWTLNLSKNIPTALYLEMGAGESSLDLSNSQVRQLDVQAGAVALDINLSKSQLRQADIKAGVGELNLDLRGDWDHDLTVDIAGGIGEINLKLPQHTGVRLKTSGLGSQDLAGLKDAGSYYKNDALGKARHTITLNVTGALGSINVTE
ncbi:toast rack family protein [Pontibacter ummariensis]|nr:toast rack family protein [Pontibacter ummariensis]